MSNETQKDMSHVWLAVSQAMNELKRQHGLLVSDIGDFSSDTSFDVDNSTAINLLYKAVNELSHALGYAEYDLDTNNGLLVAGTNEKFDASTTIELIREAICILDRFCNTDNKDYL